MGNHILYLATYGIWLAVSCQLKNDWNKACKIWYGDTHYSVLICDTV